MFHDDVRVAPGETLSTLAVAYGYRADDADKLWRDCKNAHLMAHRGAGRNLQAGDLLYVLIPWHLVQSSLVAQRHGVQIRAERDGELGTRLYQGNQPIGGTDPSCVDACPPDDDLPFYWTTVKSPPTRNCVAVSAMLPAVPRPRRPPALHDGVP